MLDNYSRRDENEVEFDPLYQYHSPNGFRMEQKQTFRESLDEEGLARFCDEFIPDDGPSDLDFNFSNYHDSRKDSKADSIDLKLFEDIRYRSKSLGGDLSNNLAPFHPGASFGFDSQEMDYLNLSFCNDVEEVFPHHSGRSRKISSPVHNKDIKVEDYYPQPKIHHEESFPVSSRSSTTMNSPSYTESHRSGNSTPQTAVLRPNEQRTYMNVNTEPSCPNENDGFDHFHRNPEQPLQISSNDSWSNSIENMQNVLFFESKFLKKYWRNDRKNIQCFPYCPEFGDYYESRIKNLNHTRAGGTCTTPVTAKFRNNFDDKSRLIALGRITLYSSSEEQQFNFNHELSRTGRRMVSDVEFNHLKKECVKGVINEKTLPVGNHSLIKNECDITFSVGVWKLNMQLSKARRPTNLPSKIPYYIFEALILRHDTDGYTLIARNVSQKFTISSTRTLLREIIAKKGKESDATSDIDNTSAGFNYDYDEDMFSGRTRKLEIFKEENDFEKKRTRFSELNSMKKEHDNIQPVDSQTQHLLRAARESVGSGPDIQKAEFGVYNVKSTVTPTAQVVQPQMSRYGRDQEYINILNQNEGILLSEAWLWAIFLGMFGGHYYYLNKTRKGLLYTFTFGIFLIGYVLDAFTMPYVVSRCKIENAARARDLAPCHKCFTRESYVYLVFLGIFGGHQYYLGNRFWGVFYTLTFAGLGLFLVYDVFFLPSMVARSNSYKIEAYRKKHGDRNFQQIDAFNRKYSPQNLC